MYICISVIHKILFFSFLKCIIIYSIKGLIDPNLSHSQILCAEFDLGTEDVVSGKILYPNVIFKYYCSVFGAAQTVLL